MAEESSTSTTVPSSDVTLPPRGGSSGGSGDGSGAVTQDFSAYYQKAFDRAYAYLRQLPLSTRLEQLEMLRKKGFQSSYKVSPTGLDPTDVSRVRELLIYQDSLEDVTAGTLQTSTLDIVKKWTPAATSGGGARTPDADLDVYLTSAMQTRLGRSPRKSEMEKFRKAYAAMEAGGNEPAATTAAGAQVETTNRGEYEASQFATFAETFEKMLRGA